MTPEQASKLIVDNGVATVIVAVFVCIVLAMFAVLLRQNSAMFNRIIHGSNGNGRNKHPIGAVFPKFKDGEAPSLASVSEKLEQLTAVLESRPCMANNICPLPEVPDVPEWLQPRQ